MQLTAEADYFDRDGVGDGIELEGGGVTCFACHLFVEEY
jgi:hypothetical protein